MNVSRKYVRRANTRSRRRDSRWSIRRRTGPDRPSRRRPGGSCSPCRLLVGSGYRSSSSRATGSMRSAGIVLPGNGCASRRLRPAPSSPGRRSPARGRAIGSVKTPWRCSSGRARSRSPSGRWSAAGPGSRRRRTSDPARIGPPTTPPNCCRRNVGLTGVGRAKKLRAFSASCRTNSKACHETRCVPAFVVRLTTPPLKRPNSAGGLLLSILNS